MKKTFMNNNESIVLKNLQKLVNGKPGKPGRSKKFIKELEDILSQNKPETKKGKTIGIISCKAGVGKSLVSINLAKQLAILLDGKPLLVDFSAPFGGTSGVIEFDSESWNTIRPLLSEPIQAKKLSTVITKTTEGFDYLASPQKFQENEPLSYNELTSLVESVKKYSPITLFDFPLVQTRPDLEKISLMDQIICIITPEPQVLVSTKNIYSIFKESKSRSWTFLLNRWDRKNLPQLKEQIEKRLGISIVASVEEDSDAVWQHYFSGKLITDKGLLVTQDLKNLATLVAK